MFKRSILSELEIAIKRRKYLLFLFILSTGVLWSYIAVLEYLVWILEGKLGIKRGRLLA